MSTFDEHYKGHGGLEMVFHEASHTLIGPRRSPISEALVAAAAELGTTPHRDLWHVVLFYTTGMTVRNILKEELGVDYEPYIYSSGLFDRAWPELRDAVERYWTPYVEGQQGYEEAAGALLRALTQELDANRPVDGASARPTEHGDVGRPDDHTPGAVVN